MHSLYTHNTLWALFSYPFNLISVVFLQSNYISWLFERRLSLVFTCVNLPNENTMFLVLTLNAEKNTSTNNVNKQPHMNWTIKFEKKKRAWKSNYMLVLKSGTHNRAKMEWKWTKNNNYKIYKSIEFNFCINLNGFFLCVCDKSLHFMCMKIVTNQNRK